VFERFTDRARKVVVMAQEAARLQHPSIGPEHVLLALLRIPGSAAFSVLTEAGIDYERARAVVIERAEPGTAPDAASAGPAESLAAIGIDLEQIRRSAEQNFGPGTLRFPGVPFSPAAKRLLPLAWQEALALAHFYVGTEHLLLALLALDDTGVLAALDADASEIRSMVVRRMAPWAERVQAANAGISRLNQALIKSRGPDRPQLQDIMRRLHDQAWAAYGEAAQRSQEAQRHLADELERVLTAADTDYRATGGSLPAADTGGAPN
jgi:ATP-dependent Clp protease ATP-binding subunit ClpA